jgi:hypothetical protein
MQRLRLAFEASRTTVAMCESHEYAGWYADQLGWLFGPAVEQEFNESRARLMWGDAGPGYPVEQARWRARYGDLLEDRPERGEPLLTLITRAREALVPRLHGLPA